MKRLWLSLLFASVSIPALAALPDARTHYQQLQGRWQNEAQQIDLTFTVAQDRLHVEGQTCDDGQPVLCDWVDQSYELNQGLRRDYTEYGAQPVDIVELTPTKLVKRETHPMVADRAAITTEELVDENTLHIVSELWDTSKNELNSTREYTLKRTQVLTQ